MRITYVSHALPPYEFAGHADLHAQHREGAGRGGPRRLGVRAARGPRPSGLPHARREPGRAPHPVREPSRRLVLARSLLHRRSDEEDLRRVPRRDAARGRALPAHPGDGRRMRRRGRGARDQVGDDAERLLDDVPDGAARLLHGLPDLRPDRLRQVRALRVRSRLAGSGSRQALRSRSSCRVSSSSSGPTFTSGSPRRPGCSRGGRGRCSGRRERR